MASDKSLKIAGKTIDIGDLRARVTFQYAVKTSDGQGGYVDVWTNLSSIPTVWAALIVRPKREIYFAHQMEFQRSHTIVVRYREDLTTGMKVVYGARFFKINSVSYPDERQFFTVLEVEENKG